MPRRLAFAVAIAAVLCACARQPAKPLDAPLSGAARALEALGPLPQADKPAEPPLPGCAPDAATAADQAPARELMQRIDRYASAGLRGADAEREWFALYAAYRAVAARGAPKVDDPRTGRALSVLSLVAVLPDPARWPAMRDTAERIAQRSPRDGRTNDKRMSAIALGLMFDALLNDTVAQGKALRALHDAASGASKDRREQAEPIIAEWRERLAREAGAYDPIAEATRQLDAVKPDAECCTVLDALLVEAGEVRARAFLRHALFERRIALGFDLSEDVLAIAQALARERPDRLARVQWGLVDGPRALEFFYAMAALADCRGRHACPQAAPDFDRALAIAPRFVRARLLRPLIEAGEDEHAERLLLEASDREMAAFTLQEGLRRMIDAGRGQRALDFARFLLTRQPSSPCWSSLDAFAFATDQRLAEQAYELLSSAPAQTPGLEHSRMLLGRSIVSVPDTGDVAATAQRLQQRLALPIATARSTSYDSDPRLARVEAASQLAALGLLEQRDDWTRQGLSMLDAMLVETRGAAYGENEYDSSFARNSALETIVGLLRAAGRSADAERLLFDELAAIGATCRRVDRDACRDRFASRYSGIDTDAAARLLIASYAEAGRDEDARLLVDRYPLWQAEDAAALSIGASCDCGSHPAVGVARSLVATGDREQASRLLQRMLHGHDGTPEAARLLGRIAGAGTVDEILQTGAPARGMRLAIAALAASGAGDLQRAAQLALAARAETLDDPWRGALDAVLGDAAAAAGDDAAAARWREGARALALAERANRYAWIGVTSRADAVYEAALAKQQPGDCIESGMLEPARRRGDHAKVIALLRRMAIEAGADASGGALGCLRGFLSLQPEEYAVLRAALDDAVAAQPAIAATLPTVIDELDADCTLSSSVDLDRICIGPAQKAADKKAAYAAAKARIGRDPRDADTLAQLYDFTRASTFPSLYGGHMDAPPAPPGVHVDVAERDGWALRLTAMLPTRVPSRIAREGDSMRSFWSPVTLLADYWRAAFEAARQSPPAVDVPVYPLAASRAYQEPPAASAQGSEPSAVPPDPAVRAGLAVGSTEIIMTAARLIEPGVHDPCTMCL